MKDKAVGKNGLKFESIEEKIGRKEKLIFHFLKLFFFTFFYFSHKMQYYFFFHMLVFFLLFKHIIFFKIDKEGLFLD